jgi:hypothetical protein
MPDYIGLYYPNIAFPSDDWVKLAALYWDKLGRIVPSAYKHQDSDTVQRLKGELNFIEDFEPSSGEIEVVGGMFNRLLDLYGRQLSARSLQMKLKRLGFAVS